MFTARTVIDWLTGLGVDLPLVPGAVGQLIPKMPDRLGVITVTPGGPLQTDGLVETPAFQVRVRGAQQDPYDAEVSVKAIDRLILFAPMPVTVDGCRLVSVTRSGGGPAALTGLSPGNRADFVCTYITRALI